VSTSVDDQETGLLEGFLAQIVVDEYADVPVVEQARPWAGRHWAAIPATLLIGLLIAIAAISTRSSDEQRQQTRDALVERVSVLTTTVSTQQERVDAQSADVDVLRAQVLDAGSVAGRADEIAALADVAGATQLAGPGLTVTIDDAVGAEAGSLNRVLDRDLQDIVNALWQMGASGVAVNDQRLTAATAIRGAGDAILVNYQPLTRPYVVSAVGTTTSGGRASGLDGLLTTLADDYGLVSDVSTGDVALPAGEVRAPRFATVDGGGQQQ
jgi:uncharacterized protein YlxW (UPF0749 family)